MKTILAFDLDDTLYDELTYVDSGFAAVARFLEQEKLAGFAETYAFMQTRLAGGRGRIFDDLLLHFGSYSRRNVRRCLTAYRLHKPAIQLYPEAVACLARFKAYPLYIVTDGNKVVQYNKIIALGLPALVDRYLITHRFGVHHAKPSPYCFTRICAWEKVEPAQVVYVADNPRKDFIGIKPLGFRTIRVLTGQHRSVEIPEEYQAEQQIVSLNALDDALASLFRRREPHLCKR
ncbi:HAD family hydrolase|uniref:Putative hydrolase of the HAD superfamily n=1 Tax=Dendrosporobacter quercicolus TaxID=146817 RepID=A0A1G9WXD7_9FIRM|nr:HAD family hydrolase [Dendrosporobacter quercicolus]NSL49234.1 HAD family hydrolase [Dendrosporobacter quercicolus DSM 1736]SDM88826.1 putative hydrolase of the HAD superfamily [Dendrosporobacter quercicolus]